MLNGEIAELKEFLSIPLQECEYPQCSSKRNYWRRLFSRGHRLQLNGNWYCASRCFQAGAELSISRILLALRSRPQVLHRIPLGLLLLSRGQLSNTHLRQALARQSTQNGTRLGTLLTQMGYANEQQVTAALAAQWACPTLASGMKIDPACASLLPARIAEHFRILPVRYTARTGALCVAFSEGVNYPLLYAIDSMLDCRTEACLISKRDMDAHLSLRRDDAGKDVFFDRQKSAGEIAHILASYALRMGAEKARLVGCEEYIWARLERRNSVTNILFHCNESPSLELSAKSPSVYRQAVG